MRETLIILGLGIMAAAMRSARCRYARKLGALCLLVASFFLMYFITDSIAAGWLGVAAWAFLPWIELLTRIRRMRLPIENRLNHQPIPNPSFFPNAAEAAAAMEEEGFEHASDCGWEWDGMQQHFRLYWNPEERAVAAICLCEQCDVAFAFITVTSLDDDGRIWRTTNFPFAPTLKCSPDVQSNHVPCRQNCFHEILASHRNYLGRQGIANKNLRIPDPDDIEEAIENEMRKQVAHNLSAGIIRLTEDNHFQYSKRGLLFLWIQFVKDMVRFC